MRCPHIVALVALGLASSASARAQKYPPVQPEPTERTEPTKPTEPTPPSSAPTPDPGPSAADVIRPSTNPHFFVGAVGPSFFGLNSVERAPGFRQTAFIRGKVALDYGYHVSGDGEGFAVGVTVEQSFDGNFYILNPGFKMWWDIQVTDMGIYAAPFAKLGYAFAACEGCGNDDHAFNLALGAEARVVFDDRWIALFRPIQIDTYLGEFFEEVFLVSYDVLIGGGLTF